MLLQHFHRIPELLFIFDKISLPQYGLYCKQIISTKSAQYFLLPQKKSHIRSQKSLVTVCSLFNHPRSRYLRSVPQLHL